MTLIRDDAYHARIRAAADAAPEPPRASVDLARRTLGRAIRDQQPATAETDRGEAA